MWVVSGLFAGVLWRNLGHYTCYLQLDLISALYVGYLLVIWGNFTGNLPFTVNLRVILGPLFYKSTDFFTPLSHTVSQKSADLIAFFFFGDPASTDVINGRPFI